MTQNTACLYADNKSSSTILYHCKISEYLPIKQKFPPSMPQEDKNTQAFGRRNFLEEKWLREAFWDLTSIENMPLLQKHPHYCCTHLPTHLSVPGLSFCPLSSDYNILRGSDMALFAFPERMNHGLLAAWPFWSICLHCVATQNLTAGGTIWEGGAAHHPLSSPLKSLWHGGSFPFQRHCPCKNMQKKNFKSFLAALGTGNLLHC